MNISGVVVRTHPSFLEAVSAQLSTMPGVEIHAASDDGRMVVTIENDAATMIDTMNSFHNIKGVVSASLIYHHFDEFEHE
jgi:nitrate reductase NapD